MTIRIVRRLGILAVVVAAFVLVGCGQEEWVGEASPVPVVGPYASAESNSSDGRSVTVMVALAEDGERGDLPSLVEQNKELAKGLAAGLTPLIQPFWEGDDESQMAVLSYVVIGAARQDDEVWVFARKDFMTYAVYGGRLAEVSGDAGPARIRMGADAKVLALDEPSEVDYDEERLTDYLPTWALARTQYDSDVRSLDDAAWRWARKTGSLPELVPQTAPDSADPHGHSPDVYSVGALPASAHGFSIRSTPAPELIEGEPNVDDYEQVSSSSDSRFVCYLGSDMLFHDMQSNRWYQLEGPNLYGQEQDYMWVGHVVVFDVIDMGFSELLPELMTGIHVEVDLETVQVERVVPIGPYTLNSQKD